MLLLQTVPTTAYAASEGLYMVEPFEIIDRMIIDTSWANSEISSSNEAEVL